MANNTKQEEVLENVAETEETKVEEVTTETEVLETEQAKTTEENSPEEVKSEENSENLEKTEDSEETDSENSDETEKEDITGAKEEKTSEKAEKQAKTAKIRAKLLCNCEYGKIGDVVEVSEDVFKALGEGYIEKTKDELTKKESIIVEKSEKEIKEERKEREEADRIREEERNEHFRAISKIGEEEEK